MTPTQETITSSGQMLRRSFNGRDDYSMSFWMSRPTFTLLTIYFIMVIGVGCILHFELRPPAESSPVTVAHRPAQLVSAVAPPLRDSLPPQETLPSEHE